MKRDALVKKPLSENPRRGHMRNALSLLNPYSYSETGNGVWLKWLFTLVVFGGVWSLTDVDPRIAGALVSTLAVFACLAFIAGCARLIEYRRVLRYLRQHGVRSYFNGYADALYRPLFETKGRRKVLAAALATLSRPAMYDAVLASFRTKGYKLARMFSSEWWGAVFSPKRFG